MYYAMRASAPSLHRESTDSLINSLHLQFYNPVISIDLALVCKIV